jgi:hypothetical protein
MLQSLAIRRSLVTIEVILALLIVAGAGLVAGRFLNLLGGRDSAGGEARANLPEDTPDLLSAVKPRSEYERIVTSALFGSSGQTPQEAPAPPSPPLLSAEGEGIREGASPIRRCPLS